MPRFTRVAEPLARTGLGGDGDEIFALEDVERRLNIRFLKEDMERCGWVGDLYNVILKYFPDAPEHGPICVTAASFYALRRVLADRFPDQVLRPATDLRSLLPNNQLRDVWRAFEERTGLELPRLDVGWTPVGPLFRLMQRSQPRVAGLLALLLPLAVVAAVPAFTLTMFFVRQLPRGLATLGDLASNAAAMNYEKLAGRQGAHSRDDLWYVLVTSISHECGCLPARIVPATRII